MKQWSIFWLTVQNLRYRKPVKGCCPRWKTKALASSKRNSPYYSFIFCLFISPLQTYLTHYKIYLLWHSSHQPVPKTAVATATAIFILTQPLLYMECWLFTRNSVCYVIHLLGYWTITIPLQFPHFTLDKTQVQRS